MSQVLNLPLPSVRVQSLSSSSSSFSNSSFRFLSYPPLKRSRPSMSAVATAVMDAQREKNLYEVLRVKQNASAREIKSAYRSLAKVYHPDTCRSEEVAPSEFIAIHNAYETLSDPTARALYDMTLMESSRRCCRLLCVTRRWETDQCW